LNFGVQIAWIAVSLAGIVLFQYLRRRSAIKQRDLSLAKKGEKSV
jgi:hypothetical protein